jgi:hypothetical protein
MKKEKHLEVRIAAAQALLEQYAAGQERAIGQVLALLVDAAEEPRVRLAEFALLPMLRASARKGLVKRLAQDPAPAPGPGAEEAAPKLSADQIDSLVAPIALYPDPLLSQTLVAATYPIEIIQAGQWLAKNKDLKGEALTAAAEKQNWDPSVQAMVAIPDVI